MEKITREELLKAKIPGEETGIQVKTGFCGFCGGDCLLDFYIKDGKIIKTEGNCTLPGANGRVCFFPANPFKLSFSTFSDTFHRI